jgi:hypothetical protein
MTSRFKLSPAGAEKINLKKNLGAVGVCPDRVVTKATPRGGFETPARNGDVRRPLYISASWR